jgi:hypothetical protein
MYPNAKRRLAWTCAGAVMLTYSTSLPAPDIPAKKYVLINGSGLKLNCTIHVRGRGWSPAFALSAGAEWDARDYNAVEPIHIRCGRPVRQQPVRLVRGKRYALLKPVNGIVEIIEVTASPGEEPPGSQ